jgi:hypothetical protein
MWKWYDPARFSLDNATNAITMIVQRLREAEDGRARSVGILSLIPPYVPSYGQAIMRTTLCAVFPPPTSSSEVARPAETEGQHGFGSEERVIPKMHNRYAATPIKHLLSTRFLRWGGFCLLPNKAKYSWQDRLAFIVCGEAGSILRQNAAEYSRCSIGPTFGKDSHVSDASPHSFVIGI